MRKLMWAALGFGGACLVWTNRFWNGDVRLPVLILLGAALGFGICGFFLRALRPGAAVCIGIALGLAWFAAFRIFYLEPLRPLDTETIPLTLSVSAYPEASRYSDFVDGWVTLEGKPYHVRAYLEDADSLEPGDVIKGSFRIRLTEPGAVSESHFDREKGIFLKAEQKGEIYTVKADRVKLFAVPALLARRVRQTILACFPADTAGFALALFLGDTSCLGYGVDTALKVSGIRHLAAVSGLHVAMLYGAVQALCRKNRILTPIIAIPLLVLFAAAAGFTPSVTRACVMMAVMAVGGLLWRQYDASAGLSAACLGMMTVNPFVVNAVSFQLSVASVAGMLLVSAPLNRILRGKLPKRWRYGMPGRAAAVVTGSLSVSAGTMLLTTPLSVYYFGMVSLIGPIANLLIVWIVSGIFIGIALTVGMGMFFPAAGMMAGGILSLPIRYVLWTAQSLSQLPFAAVYTESRWILGWLCFAYVLIALCLLGRGKHPGRYAAVAAVSLGAVLCISFWQPKMDTFRMTVIDVGEGQSILLQSKGHGILIDCGGDSEDVSADRVARTLLSQGIHTLDAVALTHYDRDHTDGLLNLLDRVEISRFYFPDMDDKGFLERFGETGAGPYARIDRQVTIPLGEGKVTFYPPGNTKTANENCMCVLFETENCAILITGDRSVSGEKQLIAHYVLPDVDILIAGHHGSAYSTSPELLEAVTPEIVVISAGKDNYYGHPAQSLLDRLEAFGCRICRTDQMGNVVIRRQQWRRNRLPAGICRL